MGRTSARKKFTLFPRIYHHFVSLTPKCGGTVSPADPSRPPFDEPIGRPTTPRSPRVTSPHGWELLFLVCRTTVDRAAF